MNLRMLGGLVCVSFTLGLGCTMDNPAFDGEQTRRETKGMDTLAEGSESGEGESGPETTTTTTTSTTTGDGDGDPGGDGDGDRGSESTSESSTSTTGDGDGDGDLDTGGDGDGDIVECEFLGEEECGQQADCQPVFVEGFEFQQGLCALGVVFEECIWKDECTAYVEGQDPFFWCDENELYAIGLVNCWPSAIDELGLVPCPPPGPLPECL